ncbi:MULTISPECIES: zinc-binding dehydrogenase [unclassified Streptomyces]|uniref:zinc-binding dehydrogenase n=1 Tax=unclassified Streptomyces TaxID=2593676 RepID=UPI002DD8B07D|nr:alcohol dehydrogenase catalytic domain-containing protein [Streptomyces sp. NBC_01445]WSE02290.1 alcohol dehydrogenase catalytic domain-containing protein [Streptomyces sp. NBC_01445]
MRAAVMYGAGDVRVEDRPDPKILKPADAVVRVLAACVCGSDLWPYQSMPATETGRPMGHEFLGIVEETGADVPGLKTGDLVVAPFTYSDNTCDYCAKGLHISCRDGGRYGFDGVDGGQGEAVRVPHAGGTLIKLPVAADTALLPSLLALSDVMTTGHHGAVTAGVGRGDAVLVVGDGAVGLCAVIAAKRLGAERIVLAGRHEARTGLGREFGATDVVAERGEEGIARIRELTGGVDKVIEAVGTRQALDTALGAALDGGTISRLGVPQYEQGPIGPAEFMRNITLTGGASPARAYIEQLLPDVLDGTITPGRVFDQEFPLHQVPDAYRAMADRQVLKALIRP